MSMSDTPDSPEVERMKALMKQVYADGFNIYQCLNRLKKRLKLVNDFPIEAITGTCEEYLKNPKAVQEHWPWFIRVFKAKSGEYFSSIQQADSEQRRKEGREPVSTQMRDIIRSMGQ